MIEEYLNTAIEEFNKKGETDPKLAKELQGVRRIVEVQVSDGDTYNFILENAHVSGLQKGKVENPDIKVIASSETFDLLWKRELRPMKALALKKLQVKASLQDMLTLRKFF
jgi:putative sterol carrier protein